MSDSLEKLKSIPLKIDEMKTLCIDFDGVIHKYPDIWGEPVEGAMIALERLYKAGFKLYIQSGRQLTHGSQGIIDWMAENMKASGVYFQYELTSTKPVALAYIDDRGIRFTNWRDILNYFLVP